MTKRVLNKLTIKGPRSALTDFIEKEGISIKKIKQFSNQKEITKLEKKEITKLEKKEITKLEKKEKKIRKNKPFEMVNKYNFFESLENLIYKHILINKYKYKFNDKQLEIFSNCMSKNRNINEETYKFIIERCKKRLIINDCSKIKDLGIIKSNKIEHLELRLCGQIKKLENIIKGLKELKTLIFTGCFSIENINIPNNIKYLDLSYSSRLSINCLDNLKGLKYLNISFFNGLNKDYILKYNIESIECEETLISDKFFKNINIKNIKILNINNCPNITEKFNFQDFKRIEILKIEGISTIKTLNLPKTIKILNIKNCFGIKNLLFLKTLNNLEELNISGLLLDKNSLNKVLKLKNLKKLDISWIESITDEYIKEVCKMKSIYEISIFGCFNISEDLAKYSWNKNNKINIIGNTSETKYLLN